MGFLSVFNKQSRSKTKETYPVGFLRYKNPRPSYRKPFTPKISAVHQDRQGRRQGEKLGRILRIFKLLFFCFALGAAFYAVFSTSLFEIQKVNVKGEADTLEEQTAIKTKLQDYLGENLLLMDISSQEDELLQTYAYLKTLKIKRRLFHTLSVILETYPPVTNVRMNFEDDHTEYYVLNEQGYITSVGSTLENLPLIVMDVTATNTNLPGTKQNINEELIPKDTLTVLLETSQNFEGKFSMQVLEIYYFKRAREIHLYTERYFFVWIDMTQDIEQQLSKLKKALTELNIYDAPLEYIDLRISGQNGEKVLYKLSPIE